MKLLLIFCVEYLIFVSSEISPRSDGLLGQKDGHDYKDPLIGQPDGHDRPLKPVIGKDDGHENNKPLLGRNDGHDSQKGPLIGQPDGHDGQERSEIGKDDGHENGRPLLGRNDGHDGQKGPLIGQPDGHDGQQGSNIGKDDGYENKRPLLGRNDGHDGQKGPLIGQPDGHDGQQGSNIEEDNGHKNKGSLLGRNDGHDGQKGTLIGQPDGHDGQKEPLIGQPDGHDGQQGSYIGKNDGHEQKKPLIGRKNGHDQGGFMIGKPDNHEKHGPIIGGHDGHEEHNEALIEQPDKHEGLKDTVFAFGRKNFKISLGKMINEHIAQFDNPLSSEDQDSKENDDYDPIDQDDTYEYEEQLFDVDSIERDEDDEALVRCKRPMCEMNCQYGFQTDVNGCPVCSCLADPCLDVTCEIGMKCDVQECSDVFKCTKLSAKCIPKRCDGPEPMCANFCQYGYQLNDRGCMTCFCRLAPPSTPAHEDGPNCGAGVCKVGQICRWKQGTANSPEHLPQCKPMPVCYTAQEQSGLSRDVNHGGAGLSVDPRIFVPKCRDDGKFEPRQCHNIRSECWCVDDRGAEVFGSRSSMYVEDQKLNCKLNQSMAVRLDMVFNDGGIVLDNKLTFERNLVEKLVGLLSLDEANIKVEKIFRYQSPRDDVDKTIIQTRVILALIRVLDEEDLPSAVEYFKFVAKVVGFAVDSNGKSALLDSDSIRSDYVYEEGFEEMGHSPLSSTWFYCRKLRQHQVMITIILLVLMILTLVCAILLVRRRCGRRQIRHHQLQNKLTFAQSQGLYKREPLKNESVMLITDDILDKEKSNMA